MEKENKLIGDIVKIKFEIGNHYTWVNDVAPDDKGYINDQWWTAFVRLKNPAPEGLKLDKMVKYCLFELPSVF